MAKANPKAWFTSPIAKITYKSVDKHAHYQERFRPFFPTWAEAHAWMLEKAKTELLRAERDAKRARRFLEKVQALKEPSNG